jgi:hypothetical protein
MRSELVFGAAVKVSNRYLLTSVASKATRILHRPYTRLEDTSNDAFRAFGRVNPTAIVGHPLLRVDRMPSHRIWIVWA